MRKSFRSWWCRRLRRRRSRGRRRELVKWWWRSTSFVLTRSWGLSFKKKKKKDHEDSGRLRGCSEERLVDGCSDWSDWRAINKGDRVGFEADQEIWFQAHKEFQGDIDAMDIDQFGSNLSSISFVDVGAVISRVGIFCFAFCFLFFILGRVLIHRHVWKE